MEGLAEAVRSVILSNQDSLKNVDIADLQQYGKGSSNFKGYAYDMLQFIENCVEEWLQTILRNN